MTGEEKKKKRRERGNEIDEQGEREGDWVVSRPTSLTSYRRVSRRK